jgi:hypothetical protein
MCSLAVEAVNEVILWVLVYAMLMDRLLSMAHGFSFNFGHYRCAKWYI